jgi:HEAT repeat protein
MDTRGRVRAYVSAAVVALILIGWLTARYLHKRELLRSLGTNDMDVRTAAAAKLLEMRKLEVSLPAQPIIRRSKAAQALGEVGSERALQVLGVILQDQEEKPREWARRALAKQGGRAVPIFMDALAAGAATRDEAITGLVQIGPELAPQVRFLLTDRSAYDGAAKTLARMPGQGIDALLSACYNPDAKLRTKALANLGDQEVQVALGPALDNLKPGGRKGDAIKALGLIGDQTATPAVIPFLTDKDNRTAAVTALGQIGDPRAVEPILDTLTETDKEYRNAAILALNRIGAPAFGALVRELRSPEVLMRRGAAAALEGSESPQIVPALTAALNDADEEVRASAARALGWEGNLAAVGSLVNAVSDPSWRVVDAAVEALAAVGVRAMDRLLGVLADPGEQLAARYHVARALAEMGRPAVPYLIEGLAHPQVDVKKWCAVALGQIGDARAVEPLEKLHGVAQGDLKWVVQEQLRLLTRIATSS